MLNSDIEKTAVIDDTRAVCRDHAAGKCRRGASRCQYRHISRPGGRDNDSRPKCDHCGKPGHLAIKCYRRIREEKEKRQDSTNVTKGCSKCDCKQGTDDEADQDYDNEDTFAIDDATYVTMTSEVALAVAALKPKGYSLAPSVTMTPEVALAVAALKPKGYAPGTPSKGIVMIVIQRRQIERDKKDREEEKEGKNGKKKKIREKDQGHEKTTWRHPTMRVGTVQRKEELKTTR